MNAAVDYYEKISKLLVQVRETQLPKIHAAAELCAERISKGGLVFLFGAGHSRMMIEEMTPRQGCYVGFFPLVELSLTNHSPIIGCNSLRLPLHLEKYEGYAEEILKGFKFGPNDAFFIISTSGIRPVIVEMAMGAKKRGMPVIAMISLPHCNQSKPGHSSGKKLTDFADIVLDNGCPPGDCLLELPGLDWRIGPTSTLTGAMIMNMLRCETAQLLLERGFKPTVLPSHQFTAGAQAHAAEEQLERFYEDYRKSVAHLYQ